MSESSSVPEFGRMTLSISPETAASIRRLKVIQAIPATEIIRRATGLYDYGRTLDNRGHELYRKDTDEAIPVGEGFMDDNEDERLLMSVIINKETIRVLGDTAIFDGVPVDVAVDRSVRYMMQVVDAQSENVPLDIRPKPPQ